jgi:hypothetical protein
MLADSTGGAVAAGQPSEQALAERGMVILVREPIGF